mmetsp:Transcript_45678/g.105418  ORF Transcript_45678/g.105418 Transcript_45678/m.105418 type:complete len:421 (+) Transcript_45678:172-1434(+)
MVRLPDRPAACLVGIALGVSVAFVVVIGRRRRAAFSRAKSGLSVRGRPCHVFSRGAGGVALEAALRTVLGRLRAGRVIGLDAEWAPGSRRAIAVLQLASTEEVLVLHLAALELTPGAHALLRDFLADPAVIKLGVGVAADGTRLRAIGLPVGSHVDIVDDLVPELDLAPADLPRVGGGSLRALSSRWLNCRLSKAEQCSNWGAADLTDSQLVYAALDALVSLEVALAMHAASPTQHPLANVCMATTQCTRPDRDSRPQSGRGRGRALAAGVIPPASGSVEDAGSASRGGPATAQASEGENPWSGRQAGGQEGGQAGGQRRVKSAYKMPARTTELYENCLILAPDGEKLSGKGKCVLCVWLCALVRAACRRATRVQAALRGGYEEPPVTRRGAPLSVLSRSSCRGDVRAFSQNRTGVWCTT